MFREISPQNKPEIEQNPTAESLKNKEEKVAPEIRKVIPFDQDQGDRNETEDKGENRNESVASQEAEEKIFSEDELVNLINGDSNKKAAFRALVNESAIPWDKLGSKKAFSNPRFLEDIRKLADEYLTAWRGTDSGKENRIKDCRKRFKEKAREFGIEWEEEKDREKLANAA